MVTAVLVDLVDPMVMSSFAVPLAFVGLLLVVAVAGVARDKLRGSRSGLRGGGNDTMARYYNDVGDSHRPGPG